MKSFLTIILYLSALSLFSKDKGIGVLFVSPDLKGKIQIDIYEKNTSKSKLLGSFLYENAKEGQTNYKVQVKELQTDNLIEFEYERLGLPISEVGKGWLKVIYGYNKLGKELTGWIEHKEGTTRYYLWKDYLKEAMLYFESPDSISFFNEPNGTRIEFKLQPSTHLKYDYIMKSVAVDGIWMKVEVTTPSDYCQTPETKQTKLFWIKYLDQRGRPLVWYFTRGC